MSKQVLIVDCGMGRLLHGPYDAWLQGYKDYSHPKLNPLSEERLKQMALGSSSSTAGIGPNQTWEKKVMPALRQRIAPYPVHDEYIFIFIAATYQRALFEWMLDHHDQRKYLIHKTSKQPATNASYPGYGPRLTTFILKFPKEYFNV